MTSWWRAYLIAAVFVAIGLAPNCIGNSPLDDLRREQQELVSKGAQATAVITHLEQGNAKSANPSVAYEFSIAGQKHYGSADPGASDYPGMSVGGPIQILYLPSDPDISGYHPERSPRAGRSFKAVGRVVLWIGFALLLITAAADFRRRK